MLRRPIFHVNGHANRNAGSSRFIRGYSRRAGLRLGSWRNGHRRLNVIEDARAGFALEDFVGVAPAQFLKDVRTNAHSAEAASFVTDFGEADSVPAGGDIVRPAPAGL